MLLFWVREEGLQVGVAGSGSNLLVADAGVPGLVPDKELSTIDLEDTHIPEWKLP